MAFAIVVFPNEHPNYQRYLNALEYWKDLFGHARSGELKGFIELQQSID
jgi:hypothetical protein